MALWHPSSDGNLEDRFRRGLQKKEFTTPAASSYSVSNRSAYTEEEQKSNLNANLAAFSMLQKKNPSLIEQATSGERGAGVYNPTPDTAKTSFSYGERGADTKHFAAIGFPGEKVRGGVLGQIERIGDRIHDAGDKLINLDKIWEENKTGEKIDNAVKNSAVGSTVLSGLSKFYSGVTQTAALPANLLKSAGVDGKAIQWVIDQEENIKNINDDFSRARQKTTGKYGKVGEVLGDLGASAISAVPSAVLSVLSGGAGTISKLAPKASGIAETLYQGLSQAVKNPQYWTTFLSTLGGDYDDAVKAGGNAGEALVSAIGSSLVNSAIEVGGGIETLPEQLRSGNSNRWVTWLKSGLEEAEEEPAQNVVSQVFQKTFADRNKKVFSTTDNNAVFNPKREAQSAAMAGAGGLLLGLGQLAATPNQTVSNDIPEPLAAKAAGYDENAKVDGVKAVLDALNPQRVQNMQEGEKTTAAQAFMDLLNSKNAAQQNIDISDTQSSSDALDTTKKNPHTGYDAETNSGPTHNAQSVLPQGSPEASIFPSEQTVNPNVSQNSDTQSVGAAEAGFTGKGMEGEEKTSRLGDTFAYNKYQREATGLGKNEHNDIWKYQSQTEERSQNLAEQLLYYQQNGEKTFLKDVDEDAYKGITDSLRDATAWNGPQTDAAYMIQRELQGRSVDGGVTETEYIDWLKTMREHATSTGQGVQANAKWSRTDNVGGSATELDAWDNLQKGNLSEDEKKATFRKIADFDQKIGGMEDGNTESMKQIILDVANERGTLNGLTGRQSRLLTSLASKSMDSMTFEQLKNMAYASTSALSTDSVPVNLGQKIKTIQILSMLSSPKTAVKNLTGNTTFYGIDALAMKGAAILDMAESAVTGTRSVAFERGAMSKGSLSDAAKAMQMAIAEITLDVDMDGESSRYGTTSNSTFKANGNFADRVMHAIERNQAYLLNATDEFYKGSAKGTAARTQALVDAGKIVTDNENYASNQAAQLAKYRTFQDNSKLSAGIQQLHDVLNLFGVGDSGKTIRGNKVSSFGLGDIVAPFTKVAGNLASRGLDYSPVNAAKGVVEIVSNIARASGGNADAAFQAKGVSDFARGMTGTAIAAGAWALAKSGLLRKADDENDKDVQAQNQAEGMTGTQLNLGAAQRYLQGGSAEWKQGDTLVDLSSIEPLNLLLNLGAEMAQSDQNPIVSSFMSVPNSFAASASELPVLQSVGNFTKDVFQYGQDWKETAAEQAANTVVSSVVPNALRAVAKATDDRPRQTYSGNSVWDHITDNVKNSIPGLRETLPGSVDGFGNAKTYQGTAAEQAFNSLLNPAGVNHYAQDSVSKELESVRKETGDTSIYPSKNAPSSVQFENEKYSMTAEQKNLYQTTRGQYIHETMSELIGSDAYKAMSAERKAEILSNAVSLGNEMAKAEALSERGVDYTSQAWNQAFEAIDAGASAREYLTYRSILNATKAKDSATQAEALSALEQTDSSQKIKGAMWQNQSSEWSEAKNPYTGTAAESGVDTETILGIMTKKAEIDNEKNTNPEMKASEQATEFSKYLDGLNLTDQQREAVDSTYGFYQQLKAKPEAYNYDTLSKSGKAVYDHWGKSKYSETQFAEYYTVIGNKKKPDAIASLKEAGLSYAQAVLFYNNSQKVYK